MMSLWEIEGLWISYWVVVITGVFVWMNWPTWITAELEDIIDGRHKCIMLRTWWLRWLVRHGKLRGAVQGNTATVEFKLAFGRWKLVKTKSVLYVASGLHGEHIGPKQHMEMVVKQDIGTCVKAIQAALIVKHKHTIQIVNLRTV